MGINDIAKNLLLEKTCDKCIKTTCTSGNNTCSDWVGFARFEKGKTIKFNVLKDRNGETGEFNYAVHL